MSTATAAASAGRTRSPAVLLLMRLIHRRIVVAGLALLVLVIGLAVFAPWVAPYSPQRMQVAIRLQPPSAGHLARLPNADSTVRPAIPDRARSPARS